ncbi:hypothetical protein BCV72DRAFT_236859 [Rhizopus microsporus var. microsporus]|uniref:Ser-Thr-rich glycosyl-phosphatidyl-inositol-anchored membrane family-domain-containing protein n=2 Tax=Rhizopus microsporus TaxID=58291 RepID=A0A2G4T4G0_RHIZD|nr:uncharacterized protein RHIMIDRAFT_272819 [Rhizopus microsporus ATCC 52813]ORE01162.1 hypothetical protein BCV72DRAFT_236859 [Rhizopus microsporus var. microsporus]PHZ15566.1 hypothetical protein RHIMIDRAFT_272819 [Rhizopus microsporus ATCC 52813]
MKLTSFFLATAIFSSSLVMAMPIEKRDDSAISVQSLASGATAGSNLTIHWTVHGDAAPLIDILAISSDSKVSIVEGLNSTISEYAWAIPNDLVKDDNTTYTIQISYPVNQTVSSEPFVISKAAAPLTPPTTTHASGATVTLGNGLAGYTAVASITLIGQDGKVTAQSQSSDASSLAAGTLVLLSTTAAIFALL